MRRSIGTMMFGERRGSNNDGDGDGDGVGVGVGTTSNMTISSSSSSTVTTSAVVATGDHGSSGGNNDHDTNTNSSRRSSTVQRKNHNMVVGRGRRRSRDASSDSPSSSSSSTERGGDGIGSSSRSSSSGSFSDETTQYDNDNNARRTTRNTSLPVRRRAAVDCENNNHHNNGSTSSASNYQQQQQQRSRLRTNKKTTPYKTQQMVSTTTRTILIMALCLIGFIVMWDLSNSWSSNVLDINDDNNSSKEKLHSSSSSKTKKTSNAHADSSSTKNTHNNDDKKQKTSKSSSKTKAKKPTTLKTISTSKAATTTKSSQKKLKKHPYQSDTSFEFASSSSSSTSEDECGIWMAPSSIRPYPGYGIYTTRNISHDDYILHAPDAISIPLANMRTAKWKNQPTKLPLYEQRRTIWKNVFSNYVWARGATDHALYDNPSDSVDYQPGFGSLPNHHCILQSLGMASVANPYRDNILGNRTSPGIGASTYSLGRAFYALRDLQAGEEIFLNYGHCSREDNSPSWAGNSIFPEDILEAVRIVKLFEPFESKEWPQADDDNSQLQNLIDSSSGAIPKFVIAILSRLSTKASREKLYDLYQSILDKNHPNSSSRDVVAHSMARAKADDTRERLAQKRLVFEVAKLSLIQPKRDISWVKQNGICLEQLVPKTSLLPDAGFGGFSQYGVKKGEIVVPVPVLHITEKDILEQYDVGKEGKIKHTGSSVLLNYCFGHPHSPMLLCPMTSALLINHCSVRTKACGPKGPNARVQWSSGWDPNSHEWRTKSLSDIENHSGRILSLEVVATRDIKAGEEVYIDYGEAWEEAWIEHVIGWEPPNVPSDFISAEEMNGRTGPIPDVLMSHDLRKRVRHPYLFAGCQYRTAKSVDNRGNYTEPNKDWQEMSDRHILETYGSDGSDFEYEHDGKYADHRDKSHWPCSVIRAEAETGRYTVHIHQSPFASNTAWKDNKVPRLLTSYRQESIHWFVNPTATDQRLPNSFRHSMTFTDFPEEWKLDVVRNNRRLGKNFFAVS